MVSLGGQRRQCESRDSHRAVQPDRILLLSARDLHRGSAYSYNDRNNDGNHGRGTDHHWDGDKGSEAGSNE